MPQFKATQWVRLEDFMDYQQAVEARFMVVEQALGATIQDVEQIEDFLEGVDAVERPPTEEEMAALDQHEMAAVGAIAVDPDNPAHEVDLNEETPEQEAARLRVEAMAAFERGNESAPPGDFNDARNVPDDGITLSPAKDEPETF